MIDTRCNLRRWLVALALSLVALPCVSSSASAQYFGRNKVQYEAFDFRVLQTPHFDVYFYPEEEEAVREAARMAERWYTRFTRLLDYEFDERQPLILYATHPDFQQTNVLGGSISEGTGGVTEAFQQRVVMPFAYSMEETDHVLGHELVHAFQYDISGMGRAGGGIEEAARRFAVPLWFIEGMAEYLSVGPVDPLTAMWVRDAALQGEIPSIEEMTRNPNVFPYRWGQALWAYVGGRWGDAAIGQILKLTGQGVPYPEAFQRILNISLEDLSEDWHAVIRRTYLPLLADLPEARQIAEPLITGTGEGGSLNVGPAVSPDGEWVVFLSELDFIDVQLHLADAETGEVVRTLQKGAAFDPHFGSIRYISSAGAWSPDSRQFVFSALRSGRDVLVFLDVGEADRIREIEVEGAGELMNPVWSPDGRTVVVSGIAGGITDLYAVDIATGESRQLTQDLYTELHPSFSPDGSTLAFTTDRGPGTDLDQLQFGPYRIALMEMETGDIRLAPGMAGPKSINPQWTRDGSGIYFISNPFGIPNIFRVELATGEVAQITNLFTGVSGITDMSPALTVAARADRLIFTAFEDGGYNIYSLTEPSDLAGTTLPDTLQGADTLAFVPAVLPPAPRPPETAYNRVSEYLRDPVTGLPSQADALAYTATSYRPGLGLNYLGQPQVGVSTGGAFGGGGLYGGVAGIFGDMLGRHTLYGAVQAQGQLDEIGFALQYINSRTRWNFGAGLQRVPMVYGYYQPVLLDENTYADQIVRLRFFNTSLAGIAQYPISEVQRLEFSAGVRRFSQDLQVFEYQYHIRTGAYMGQRQYDTAGVAFDMGEVSAALVYDNALVGYTSPFAGQRYRFEITPTVGDLTYVQALADYRRYFFLRPFTLAVRGLHFGRYGKDAEPVREENQYIGINNHMYLGYPSMVRGYYDAYSDCAGRETSTNSCAVLNQLFGSRVAVTSAELRFPLIGALVLGTSLGFPPIEGFVFGDAGVAWDQGSTPVFERFPSSIDDELLEPDPDERYLITSAGVGARINLFGYLIAEVNYARAFALDNGWSWQFNFQPGF